MSTLVDPPQGTEMLAEDERGTPAVQLCCVETPVTSAPSSSQFDPLRTLVGSRNGATYSQLRSGMHLPKTRRRIRRSNAYLI
jgi:hypothetical protein